MVEAKQKAASQQKAAAPKPVHTTASPFTKSQAEVARQPQHEVIVDRLIGILTPIKSYRAQQPVSKGKRHNKKRKRHSDAPGGEENSRELTYGRPPAQPPPRILKHTLLGFNNVTRHLETLSIFSAPPGLNTTREETTLKPTHISTVFLLHPLDEIIYSHLPTLCHTASLAHAERPATRLVLLNPKAEAQIAEAVGLPRISILALLEDGEGAAEMEALVAYVREHVEPVDVPWLREAREGRWLGTKVETR